MVSIRDPHLGPGVSRTHTKLTSGRGTISAPRPSLPSVLLNARKTRTTGATATCNDTQAFALTSRSSRYRSWDLALRESALRCSIPALPDANKLWRHGGGKSQLSIGTKAPRRKHNGGTDVLGPPPRSHVLLLLQQQPPSNALHSMILERPKVVVKTNYRLHTFARNSRNKLPRHEATHAAMGT